MSDSADLSRSSSPTPQQMPAEPHLVMRLFGPPEVIWVTDSVPGPNSLGGPPVAFRTKKTLALFVYLALTPQSHAREQLAALLWPDHDEESARTLLRNTLAFLRQGLAQATGQQRETITLVRSVRDTLGREALTLDAVNTSPRLVLDTHLLERAASLPQRPRQPPGGGGNSDSEEEAQLGVGVAAYRGPFLESVTFDDSPEFEAWVAQQRAYWLRQFERASDRLCQLRFDRGAFTEAAVTARSWVAATPLDEAATRQLMRALAAVGDRAGALVAYSALQQLLAAELGAQPTPETTAFAERVRQSAQTAARTTHPTSSSADEDSALAPATGIPFVGRSPEFEALVAAYEAAARGGGTRVVVLEGEAGIGKTRLAEEFLNWATVQGADVLRGRAVEALGRLPYQPLVGALRPRVARERAPDDLLADVWLAELVRVLPELHDRYPDLPAPSTLAVDDPSGQGRLFEAVAQLGQALASRQHATSGALILFLDDLQWADAATHDLLQYAIRRWAEERAPLLLLLTIRPEAADERLAAGLRAMGRTILISWLLLTPLAPDEVQQALQALAPRDEAGRGNEQEIREFGMWLRERTGGHPFYLVQMLRMLVDRGIVRYEHGGRDGNLGLQLQVPAASDMRQMRHLVPGTVRDMIRTRIEALGANTRDLLFAAAVLGDELTFEQMCAVSGIAEREALSGFDELLGSRLLNEAGAEPSAFPSQGARATFPQDMVREVSYTEAGEARRRVFHRNALDALERTGFTPAAELARHAEGAGLLEPLWRHSLAAGDAAMRLYAVRDALPYYEQASRLLTMDRRAAQAGQLDPLPGERAHLYLQLARAYETTNQLHQAHAIYETLYAHAHEHEDQDMAWRALTRLAVTAVSQATNREATVGRLDQALQLAEAMGNADKLAETHWNLALMYLILREPQRTIEFAQHALRYANDGGNRELQARSLFLVGTGYDGISAWEQAAAPLEEARLTYDALAQLAETASETAYRATTYSELTSIGTQSLWAGEGPATAIAHRTMQASCMYELAANRNNYGNPRDGIRVAREALRISQEIGDKTAHVMSVHELVRGLTEVGRYEEALAVAEDHRATARDILAFHQLTFLSALMSAYLAVYQIATADEALSEVKLIIGHGIPGYQSNGLWGLRCEFLALAGDWPAAADAAKAATEMRIQRHAGAHYSWWHGCNETEALLRSGEIALAREGIRILSERSHQSRRGQLVTLRMQAILAAYEARTADAIRDLEQALALAEQIDLPEQQWQIAASLARVYESLGQLSTGQQRRNQARTIVVELAGGMTNPSLRADYLAGALGAVNAPAPLIELSQGSAEP